MSVDKLGESRGAIALQLVSKGDRVDSRDMETQDISKMVALDATRESQGMEVGSRVSSKEKMVKTASKASVFIKQAMTFVKAFFATMSLSFARSHVNGFEKRDVQVFRGEQLYKKIVAASVARKNAERALSQAAKDKDEIQNESTAPLEKANASLSKADRALSKAETNFKNAEAALKGSISALLEYECHHVNTVVNLPERLKTDLSLYAGVSSKLAQEVLSEFPKLVIVKMEEKIQGIASLESFAKVEADKVAVALRAPGSEVSRDAVSSTALRDGIVTFQKNIAAKVKELKLPLTKDEVSEIQTQALISVMPAIVDRLPQISESFVADCKKISDEIESTLKESNLAAEQVHETSGETAEKEYRETKEVLFLDQKKAQKTYIEEAERLNDVERTETYDANKGIKDATDENKTNRTSIASKTAVDKSLGLSVSKDLAKEEARYGKVIEGLEKGKKDILRDHNVGLKEAENTRDTELARLDKALSAAETKKEKALAEADATLKHSLARAQTVHDKAVAELDALKTQGEANLQSLQGLLTGHKGSLIADKIANMKSVTDVEEVSQRSSDQLSDREKNLSEKVESLSKEVEILAKQVASKVGKKPIFVKVVENFSKTRQLQAKDRLAKFQEERELDQLEKKQANVEKKYSAEKKRAELQEKEARRVDLLLDSITTKETKANIAINRKLAQSFMKKKTAEAKRKEVLGRSEVLETKRVKGLKSEIDRKQVDAVKRRKDRLDDIVLRQEKAAAKRLAVINRKEMIKEMKQAAFISEVRAFVEQYNNALTQASYMFYGLKEPKTYDEAVSVLEGASKYESWIKNKGIELPFVPVFVPVLS
jgi:hypothetical protein